MFWGCALKTPTSTKPTARWVPWWLSHAFLHSLFGNIGPLTAADLELANYWSGHALSRLAPHGAMFDVQHLISALQSGFLQLPRYTFGPLRLNYATNHGKWCSSQPIPTDLLKTQPDHLPPGTTFSKVLGVVGASPISLSGQLYSEVHFRAARPFEDPPPDSSENLPDLVPADLVQAGVWQEIPKDQWVHHPPTANVYLLWNGKKYIMIANCRKG